MITEKDTLHILAVDPFLEDHEILLSSLKRSQVPAHITFTHSTAEAINILKKTSPDIIITDHHLPHSNAFHILTEAQEYHPHSPVIFLTRHPEPRMTRDAFHKGIDDVIFKEELDTTSLFDVIGNCLERKKQKEEQEEATRHLREMAERDGLTGLYNRRFFTEALEREFMRARRYQRLLSVIIIDLDGFKTINDTCGHPKGDVVIQQVGRLLLQTVRFVDTPARYGGDEFVLLLPETGLREAQHLAHRILKEIQTHPFSNDGKLYPLSASIGIAEHTIVQENAAQLLKEADEALYQAKKSPKSGRPKIVISGFIKPSLTRKIVINQLQEVNFIK